MGNIEDLTKYGTPTYIFDIDELKNRIAYLNKNMPNNVTLCFAMKANPFVVKEIEDVMEKYEVCSYGEYKICEELGVDSKKLVISGVNKNKNEIDEIMHNNAGVYTAESLNQFNLLESYKKNINVLLRLTSGNQFGMNESDIENIIKNRYKYPHINIIGIEYFSGTQKNSIKRIGRELEYLDEYLKKLEEEYGYKVEELEYGAGLPVHYYQNEEFDEDEFLNNFNNLISNMKYQGKIILELGRSIVASCGYYITKVVDMKENKNGIFAICDGGKHQLVYYGAMLGMETPIMEVYPKREGEEKEYNVCGSLCTINDFLVKRLVTKDLQIGDYLIFKNTGAYSMTEGITLFLSRDIPQVLFLVDGKIKKVRDNTLIYKYNMPRKEVI